jgi:uncharacterized protein (TIGR04255 family)
MDDERQLDLATPPLVEVVCGFIFDSVPLFDALQMGIYWNTRREEYPDTQLQPALSDGISFNIGPGPLRAWLISQDESYLIQLQHDRCFLNWRARDDAYPRFTDHDDGEGLLTRALREYQLLQDFLRSELGSELKLKRVELTKINQIVSGEHWENLERLKEMIPVLSVADIDVLDFNLAWVNVAQGGRIVTRLQQVDMNGTAAVHLEHRFVGEIGESNVKQFLLQANSEVNSRFINTFTADAFNAFGDREE